MQTETESVQDKVQHGVDLLARAKEDKDLLGISLIYLHSGVESYFRSELEAEIKQFEEQEKKRPTWPDLVDLWEDKQTLSPSNRATLLEYNTLRNSVAHAKIHDISRPRVQRYADFVQKFTSVQVITRKPWQESPLAWLIPIATLFLVVIASVWAISTFSLTAPLPSPPPTITPGSPALQPVSLDQPAVANPPEMVPVNLPNTVQKIRILAQTDIRTGPGMEHEAITLAPGNAQYPVLETAVDGRWYKVPLEPGVTGWIDAASAAPIAP
ncbi:MAG: SH3 domain-containing protein [Chloroflexota bacterium]